MVDFTKLSCWLDLMVSSNLQNSMFLDEMPNFLIDEIREIAVPPVNSLLLFVCQMSLMIGPCFFETEDKYKMRSWCLATAMGG